MYVNDIFMPAFCAWAEKEIAPKIEKKKQFISDWSSQIDILEKDELINRFSDKYPPEHFLAILDKNETAFNRLTEFFSISKNVEYVAEIICKNLEKHFSIETVKLLCLWFDPENHLEAGEKMIREFLLKLKEEDWLALFEAVLQHQSRISLDIRRVEYTDKLFCLWDERGLDAAKIGMPLFSKIKEIWKDALAPNADLKTSFRYFGYAKRDALSLILAEIIDSARRHQEYDYAASNLPFHIRVKKAYDCFYGLTVRQDCDTAVGLFSEAAERGVIDCQYDLARCYEQGVGVEKDWERAEYWYKKAEGKGHPKARERLANHSCDRKM